MYYVPNTTVHSVSDAVVSCYRLARHKPQATGHRLRSLATTHYASNASLWRAAHLRDALSVAPTPLDSLRERAYNRGKMRSFASIILRPALGLVLGRGGGGLRT